MMDHLHSLILIAAIYLATKASPGPIFFVLSRHAMAGTRRNAILIAFGVTAGSLAWAVMSLMGFAAVLIQLGWLYTGLRLAGAAYLIYLGVMLLLASRRAVAEDSESDWYAAVLDAPGALRLGLMTSLSNPKSAVFWSSVFLVVFPSAPPGWMYGATLVLVLAISFGWHMLLVVIFSTERARLTYMRLKTWIDRIAGSLLILLGVRLALDDR